MGEFTEFLAVGLADLQATAGVEVTLRREGVAGSLMLTGTFSPGAATYSVEVSGNIYAVAGTAVVPAAAVTGTAWGEPRIGDSLQVSGDARVFKVVGVRGSALDPAWHLDLSQTSAA